ncbi:hypothetical protein IWQ60_002585 [Tieghemiomyces parasiticus]|uniref:FAD/NAD(P)-binding domain-containing protein n=1 Tax=Tieghemiomyces parasiticus TaxID=78921 RepID=A0A9W8E0X8_9FUNG|nr:hypothetical protein IWQ60_002585 [Tieghemiomyces parasiticus]
MSPHSRAFHVVIIGGSFAGLTTAQELEKLTRNSNVFITVLEKREASFHTISALRALVKPELAEHIWIPFHRALKGCRSRIVQASVEAVYIDHVQLSSGELLRFDYLVLASGSSYPSPAKTDSIYIRPGVQETLRYSENIRAADRVLIIGGGAVGVELAGEIATAYPNKKVTLVQAAAHLLPTEYPLAFCEKVRLALQKLNVRVILNDRVVVPGCRPIRSTLDPRVLYTVNGLSLTSDLQFLCVGTTVNVPYLSTLSSVPGALLEPGDGHVKVLPTLQLTHPRLRHMFAVGDCNNTSGTKLAYTAMDQARVAAKNLQRLIEAGGGPDSVDGINLLSYKNTGGSMAITVGEFTAFNAFPFANLIGYRDLIRKGSDLFLPKRYRELHLEYPKG